jgi:NAD(P)-dependent dehydrogenase (short-subunit alcohol dehydrogenase family)
MDLTGKTALVTGSTSGIVLGIARSFAAANANVVGESFGNYDEIACDLPRVSADTAGGKADPRNRRRARDPGRGSEARCAAGCAMDEEIRDGNAVDGRCPVSLRCSIG